MLKAGLQVDLEKELRLPLDVVPASFQNFLLYPPLVGFRKQGWSVFEGFIFTHSDTVLSTSHVSCKNVYN